MSAKYEYEIVRHGQGLMRAKRSAWDDYEEIIKDYAERGWRLVQVFAPGIGMNGFARYFDLIFEREVD
jgi:hypothetical protein